MHSSGEEILRIKLIGKVFKMVRAGLAFLAENLCSKDLGGKMKGWA